MEQTRNPYTIVVATIERKRLLADRYVGKRMVLIWIFTVSIGSV
jgi:hypothetical protein